MTFALWIMVISSASNSAVHVSDYISLEDCKKAATEAAYVGPPSGPPTYSFVCIRNGRI